MNPKLLDNALLLRLIAVALFTLALMSCDRYSAHGSGENSIYYWRTTLKLSDEERNFLKKHDVRKVYVRFFDVDRCYDAKSVETIVPEATIAFNDTFPKEIELVPTVYITYDAISAMRFKETEYAEKILRRVEAICRSKGICFRELQLDCDWTKRNRDYFFRLCEAMKERLDSSQSLSCTIRLHQLAQTPPPVDKGVLMVYNTGNLMDVTEENSIFSYRNIEPYLRDSRLSAYSLPLDVAYPAYGWSLVYNKGGDGKYHFNRITKRTDFSSYAALKKTGHNMYEAISDIDLSDGNQSPDYIFEGYRIRVERPESKEILKVKELIDRKLGNRQHNNILYHLDETQFSHYSDNEISEIYSRP